ncbi:hypothetical protein ABE10_00080, partial [Bacillus toyonensis]|nr:hypothetical protein [Bacillus toyonensis]
DREAIGDEEDDHHDDRDDPEHLVLPSEDRGEAPGEPDAEVLQTVGLHRDERRHRADDGSEHDAHDRDDEGGAQRHPTEE